MNPEGPGDYKDVVLLGGGHSHAEVLRQSGMKPLPDARLTLIARDLHAPYSGMLPGFIAGHYDFHQSHIDLLPLASHGGCRVLHDEVESIDLEGRRVICMGRPPVSFDLLSVNVGSTPHQEDIPGVSEYALAAKPVDRFIEGWKRIIADALGSKGPYRIAVVGGGAGGVELALTMQHRLLGLYREYDRDVKSLRVHILTDGEDILPTHNSGVRRKMRRVIRRRDIHVHYQHRVTEVTSDFVHSEGQAPVPYDALIWVTHAAPARWIRESGLDTDERGFILVDETLRSTSHPFVFAAGDVASMAKSPRDKSGVFAVRQGPYLYRNLRRSLAGGPLETFRPQKRFLNLISTGDKNAIASRGNWSIKGRLIWRWKNRIDLKWMEKYHNLQPMASMGNGAMDMHCGGCGCKIGSSVLSKVLSRIEVAGNNGVVIGLDHPDDAAVVEVPAGKLAVHTIDFFRSFLDDPFVFGQVTVNHCLSDVYAMGATPQSVLAAVTLPYDREDRQEALLYDLLAGAARTLKEEGVALVGGHTTEGPELAFGFSVNGYVSREQLLAKGGMNPGDRLILTKPLGTGVIFAAQMRGKARGFWVQRAIESMLVSNGPAARCLFEYGATACTDVTGFGLAGHLVEMMRESKANVELSLDEVPVLEGAATVSAEGIRSTLYPQNLRVAAAIEETEAMQVHPVYPLLFDPQTSGGLLAAVPEDRYEQCLNALHELGCDRAARIGGVSDRLEGDVLIVLV